jgi:hypothetical protein
LGAGKNAHRENDECSGRVCISSYMVRTVDLHYEITRNANTIKSQKYNPLNTNASNILEPYLQIAGPWAWRVIPRGLTSGAARLSSQTPTPHHHHNESEAIVYSPMQRIAGSTYDLRQKSHQGNTRLSPCSTSGLALKAALLGIVPRQVLPTAHTITRTHNSQKSQLFNPLLPPSSLSSFSSLFPLHHHLHSPSSSSFITSNIIIKHPNNITILPSPTHLHNYLSHAQGHA